jgi:hypothetical protein
MLRILAPILLVFSIGSGAGQDSPARGSSLRRLQFSPDGRYVLAQNDSEITVLDVEPFAILFRIPTRYATDAQFTPDSGSVVFVRLSRARGFPEDCLGKIGCSGGAVEHR